MSMHTVQLDISNDIIDKVIAFLEILPKNKIKFRTIDDIFVIHKDNNTSSSRETSLKALQSDSMSRSWNNTEDEAWDEL